MSLLVRSAIPIIACYVVSVNAATSALVYHRRELPQPHTDVAIVALSGAGGFLGRHLKTNYQIHSDG